MEKLAKTQLQFLSLALSERTRLLANATFFFLLTGAILYLFLVATYPPIHDTVHDLRHALALVPCH